MNGIRFSEREQFLKSSARKQRCSAPEIAMRYPVKEWLVGFIDLAVFLVQPIIWVLLRPYIYYL